MAQNPMMAMMMQNAMMQGEQEGQNPMMSSMMQAMIGAQPSAAPAAAAANPQQMMMQMMMMQQMQMMAQQQDQEQEQGGKKGKSKGPRTAEDKNKEVFRKNKELDWPDCLLKAKPEVVEQLTAFINKYPFYEDQKQRLLKVMATRMDTFQEDMETLFMILNAANNPGAFLVSSLDRMEDGSFVPRDASTRDQWRRSEEIRQQSAEANKVIKRTGSIRALAEEQRKKLTDGMSCNEGKGKSKGEGGKGRSRSRSRSRSGGRRERRSPSRGRRGRSRSRSGGRGGRYESPPRRR